MGKATTRKRARAKEVLKQQRQNAQTVFRKNEGLDALDAHSKEGKAIYKKNMKRKKK